MTHVRHILDRGDETTVVFRDMDKGSVTFPTDVAVEIASALNAHFARRKRFEREIEASKETRPRLQITDAREGNETDGGVGPEGA